jgi:hypothetical protein
MINHARTLLLNVAGQTSQRQETGEEYIPSTYAPLVLPSYLQTTRRVIFGAAPDRYFLNFRARELMAYLHQTELAEYVTALDPRVTYWPEPARPFYDTEKRLVVSQFSGLAAQPPVFRGDLFADLARGRATREFTLRVTQSEGPWQALLQTPDQPGVVTTIALTFTGGLSQTVPLANTGVVFQIQQPAMTTDWTIYTRVRPASAIATVLPIIEMLGEPLFLALFGVSNSAKPYATFKQLWFDHPNPVYRMGGLALAMIYRTEEVLKLGSQQLTTAA